MIKIIDKIPPSSANIKVNDKRVKIIIKDKKFSSKSLIKLVSSLNYLLKIKNYKKLVVRIDSILFADDACILVLESIIYNILLDYKIDITFSISNLQKNILSYAFYKNSLLNQCIENDIVCNDKFMNKYKLQNNISRTVLRKYLQNDSNTDSLKNQQSLVLQDIYNFMINSDFSDSYSKDIAIAISEIVDNIFSHTDSDAILTLKIIDVIDREGEKKKVISVCVFNISNIYLHSNIKQKVINRIISETVLKIISVAYDGTIEKYNKYFDENAFYFISTFQKNVTSRDKSIGGTGLTVLLKNIIDKSYEDFCYVISGDNCLFFKKQFLNLNEDGTIGFNKSNDYYNDIPDKEVFKKLDYCINGTLFNLVFIN